MSGKKTEKLNVALRPSELFSLRAAALQYGMTVGGFVRGLAGTVPLHALELRTRGKPGEERRTETHSFMMSEEDLSTFETLARGERCTVHEYIRRRIP